MFVTSHSIHCAVDGFGDHDCFPSSHSFFDRAIVPMGRVGKHRPDFSWQQEFFYVFRWLCLGEAPVPHLHGFTADNSTVVLYS